MVGVLARNLSMITVRLILLPNGLTGRWGWVEDLIVSPV